jgi:sulfate transport system substrate-binding protein
MRKKAVLISGAVLLAGAIGLLLRPRGPAVLTVGAFPALREACEEIIPLFEADWKKKTGTPVRVRASYVESALQARAVAGGFEADVAVFSSDQGMARLEKAGLLTHPWRKAKARGVVANSIVLLAVREGNPRGIRDWVDLAKPGVNVLASDPKTSGAAPWTFLALYGAADRGAAEPYAGGDAGAFRFSVALFKNVPVLDGGARALSRFERGWGDAVVAAESDVFVARRDGAKIARVVPRSTVLIQHPAAVVDAYADKHGVRAEAEAFLDFLWTPAAQEAFAKAGFRPVDRKILGWHRGDFPKVLDLWTVEELGGWANAGPVFFGPGGLYDGVWEEVHASGR